MYGLEVCSLSKALIRLSLDYAVSYCYRNIFNVKSKENVRLCIDMFHFDDYTLLAKQKQKFVGSSARELLAVASN